MNYFFRSSWFARWAVRTAGLSIAFVFLFLFSNVISPAAAAVSDIEVTIYASPNLVVDSNVLSPSTLAPEVATVIGRFCNRSGATINGVTGYIGDYNPGTPASSTPAAYPSKTNVTIGGQLYSGTYRFTHLGGTTDAVRIIGSLAPNQCSYQYWSFTYPKTANSGTIPSWGTSVKHTDDLFLDFDVWAAEAGVICSTATCNKTHTAYMRNEISAMANKIQPNGTPPGQWFNTNSETVSVGETITTNGILYRLGRVDKGFDNDGDLVPDFNAWLQPIGNPTFDPGCFRLIEVSGQLTVSRNSGQPDLIIPFSHALNQQNNGPLLYFQNLPQDNTDVRGLVYYTFIALSGPCTVPISPYQEVASGADNEKFNGDYGAAGPTTVKSFAPALSMTKNGPGTTSAGGAAFTYAIQFQNTGTKSMGLAISTGLGASFVVKDTVPAGLQYVGGSASANNTPPASNSFVIYYSTNSGTTWSTNDPGTFTSTSPNNLVMIQWWLTQPLAASASGTVRYMAQVPGTYFTTGGVPFIENCADARLGDAAPMGQACATTMVQGNNSIGDTVWGDDGAGAGGVRNNGLQDGTEAGINLITVNLYWDKNGNGLLDLTDPLVRTTVTNSNTTANYLFANLPDGRFIVVVDVNDSDLPVGFAPTTPKQYAVALDPAGTNPSAVNVLTADFGFGPPLVISKVLLSANPAYETETVTFQINLNNTLPGDGMASGFCTYSVYARVQPAADNIPADGGSSNARWESANSALARPDEVYANTNLANNADTLSLSGFNSGNQGGTITGVKVLLYFKETKEMQSSDNLTLNVFRSNTNNQSYVYNGTTYFNQPVGTKYLVQQSLTGSWTWADFANNLSEIQIIGNGTGGTRGDVGLDAAAFVITTDQTCGGAESTISLLPLTDTYDPARLQFVSASIAPTTISAGTLSWANVGPLYPGQIKLITLNFKALDPGAVPVVTTNTASVSGAKFANGKSTNTPPNAQASVTINPTGSISGVVWSDGTGGTTGWVGTMGFENLGTTDFGIQNVTVTLFGCTYNTGTLVTTADTSKTCSGQGPGAGWTSFGTAVTAPNGSYSFTGLRLGYYYVRVTSGIPAGSTQSAEPIYNNMGLSCTNPAATCAGNWNPTGQATTVDNTNLSTANFNPIGNGNPLALPNEDIVDVNFGYDNVPLSLSGIVYADWNGNGVKNGVPEQGLSGVTVRLCPDTACSVVTLSTTTNSSGAYSFSGFAAGTYFVVVTPPANTTQTGDPDQPGVTCTTCDNRTNSITISAGQTKTGFDFGYRPSGSQSIGDTLYVDWNGNSTQDTGEEGLAGIPVSLYEDENNNGIVDAADALIATTTTNGSGNYLFSGLGNGNYLVIVDTSSANFPATSTPTQDADGGSDSKAKVTLLSGSSNLNIDFGYKPTGFGSIGDFVWRDLDADGVQDVGEIGINSVVVRLLQDDNGNGLIDGSDAVVASQNTASGGLYLFANLAPGNYIVEIAQSNFTGSNPLAGLTPTSTGSAYVLTPTQTSYTKNLAAAEAFRAADFGFAEGLIGDLIWRDDNGNGNPDSGEPGISGVTVQLYRDVNMNGVYDPGTDTLYASTTTNGSGLYAFGGLPPGKYVVVVTPPAGTVLTGDPDAYSTNPSVSAYPPCSTSNPDYVFCDHQYGITLANGQVNRSADFGYKPSGVIGDLLWVDGNANGIFDPGESGIPFVTVRLCTSAACSTVVATTSTNSDGLYSFGGIANGTYYVVVDTADPDFPKISGTPIPQVYDPDGVLDNTASLVVLSGGQITSIGGTPCSNCDLKIDFGYRYAGNNSVSGTVWFDADNGGHTNGIGDIDPGETFRYGGVNVFLWFCGTGTCSDGDEVLAGSTVTAANGTYSFTGLANGTYAASVGAGSLPLAGLTPTTPTAYSLPGSPYIVLSGGTNAVRDFGFRSTLDFGDLPASYSNTRLTHNGARHQVGNVYLGGGVTLDPDGQESLGATADSDDGVVIVGSVSNGPNGATFNITVTCPSAPCYLTAWSDWNADGDFLDAMENILLDRSVTNGLNVISVEVPAGWVGGSNKPMNIRFRVYAASTNGSAQPTGLVINGEVEDYQWIVAPTAITLLDFRAGSTELSKLFYPFLLAILVLSGVWIGVRHRARWRG